MSGFDPYRDMIRRGARRIVCAWIILIAAGYAGYAGNREQEPPIAPRKERGADMYMLNYNRFIEHGFYLSVSGKAAHYRAGWGALVGGRAALLVDHVFAIGAVGEISVFNVPGSLVPDRLNSAFGNTPGGMKIVYGGGYLAYHIFHDRIVNFSLGSLAGWGRLGGEYLKGPGSRFFIIEPELYIFLNLPRHARIGVGASYRISWGVDFHGIRDRDFRGFSVGLQVQAGLL